MDYELAPGSFWWIKGVLHLVTGIHCHDSTVTTWSAQELAKGGYSRAGDVCGCWPIDSFLRLATSAHRNLAFTR